MPGLCAELRLENVSDSPLGAVSEVMQEPVTPLSLTLLDYILNGELSSIHEYGYDELATPFGVDARQRYDLQSSTTKPAYQYVNDRIESLSDIYAVDGDLYLSLDVESRSELRDLCADIEERYGQVSVERITNIEDIRRQTDYAQINLQKLTDRQYEVIETAYRMGYFGYPRDANAKEVAASLGITSSTLTEHLNTAQAKIFEEIFQEE